MPFHSASQSSFVRRGGDIIYFNPSSSRYRSSVRTRYCVQVSTKMFFCPSALASFTASRLSLQDKWTIYTGVPSVKVYLTYDFKIDDDGVLQVLKKMKQLGGVTAFHCENHAVVQFLRGKLVSEGNTAPIYHAKSRPNLAEAEAVRRVLYLAKLAGDAPVYIVHLSCKESL